MDSFCCKLPKVELHAHLNGSLSKTTLEKLGCLESISLSAPTPNVEDVFSLFSVAHKATSNIENLYVATKSVIEEFAEDNVVYLELRTTPRKEDCMSEEDYIETVLKAIAEVDSSRIRVKLILSLDRRKSYEDQAKTLDLIVKYKESYSNIVRGVDLSGDPGKGTFFRNLFEKARDNGLYTAIHCAEIRNDDEVKEILNFKPDRLGHGTFLNPNYGGCPENWKLYTKLKIPVECCLSSNVICLVSKSYKEHHVQEWIKNSLPFCLATDDKGMFQTTLSQEFQHVQGSFNLSKKQLWDISRNSIKFSFATPDEKTALTEKLERWRNTEKI